MQVYIAKDGLGAAALAAQWMMEAYASGSRRFGLATGQTMVPVYQQLVARVREADPSCRVRAVETFNLDEYVGIAASHPGSFRSFMENHLFIPLDFDRGRTHVLDGMARDLAQECQRYQAELDRAALEFQLLGIGRNGHIGFNEPATPWDSRTHRIRLSPETLEQNRDSFPGEVPQEALTMGIGSILQAEQIVVVALGADKTDAVTRAITGPRDLECPASALQDHPRVRYILDPEAGQGVLLSPNLQNHLEIIQHS